PRRPRRDRRGRLRQRVHPGDAGVRPPPEADPRRAAAGRGRPAGAARRAARSRLDPLLRALRGGPPRERGTGALEAVIDRGLTGTKRARRPLSGPCPPTAGGATVPPPRIPRIPAVALSAAACAASAANAAPAPEPGGNKPASYETPTVVTLDHGFDWG